MAVMLRNPRSFSLTALPATAGVGAVVLLLVFANWWQFEFFPGKVQSLWGPYFFALLGWFAAAGTGIYYLRQIPAPPAEHDVDEKTTLVIAGLVGLFLVALQVIVGIFTAFGISPYAHSIKYLALNTILAAAPLLATEAARTLILRQFGEKRLTLTLLATTIGLAAVQIAAHRFTEDTFKLQAEFWGRTFIPLAATGLLAGFFAIYGGLRGALLISAPLTAFVYYSPALPVAPWTALALAGVAGPAIGLWIAEGLFGDGEEVAESEQGFFKLPSVAWVLTAIMGLVIFWFSFGFFGFKPSFVPSHSMEPLINQGDVVFVGPTDADAVKVGDIILYRMADGHEILHRVIEIQYTDAGTRRFVMKGDNNNSSDIYPVEEDQIKARYLGKVPKLGWVAIKFNQAIGNTR